METAAPICNKICNKKFLRTIPESSAFLKKTSLKLNHYIRSYEATDKHNTDTLRPQTYDIPHVSRGL